jgi:hypothetical protein
MLTARAAGKQTFRPKTLDDMMKRVGVCLQNILKNEYGDAYARNRSKEDSHVIMLRKNPRLADLTPLEALASLKSELKAYIASDDPFDRRFRENETVYQWWSAVQKRQSGTVLGVRHVYHRLTFA